MTAPRVRLGLRENWAQFALLVLVNAFVGGMVGLERSILPAIAQEEFGIAALSGVLADALGLSLAITVVAILTLISGIVVAIRMRETLPAPAAA